MGSKHDQLQEEEVSASSLPNALRTALLRSNSLNTRRLRVLDVGCGRGALVLALVRSGVDAYGIDVDSIPFSKSRCLFEKSNINQSERLFDVSAARRWPFDDSYFDVTISLQVLEHVAELDALVRELWRVTAMGGVGFHQLPGYRRVVEPHTFIPLVHWFPKGSMRAELLLRIFNRRLPMWFGQEGLTLDKRLSEFRTYLRSKTFYRPTALIHNSFTTAGFELFRNLNFDLSVDRRAPLTKNLFYYPESFGNVEFYTLK